MTAGRLWAADALLPGGWAREVLLAWDDAGTLTTVQPGTPAPPGAERAGGAVIPGLPNLHSHAFQRVFSGLTEYRGDGAHDSFWTWRDRMYRIALAVSPEQLEAIATQLYVEMLEAGYTAVCEFHYLHHAPDGRPYAERAELALRLAAAARTAGIGLTLLPVLYRHAGFGAQPPRADQRRFLDTPEGVLRMAERLRAASVRTGVAPHSLRAVAPDDLRALLDGLDAIDPGAPIHLHIAEQPAEVDACVAWSGTRPLQWLMDHHDVGERWCLVHATHLDAAERDRLAASRAVAGLCPTTEANLGDGLFDAAHHLAHGGRFGIGSDSHASVDAAEELRLLEYGQRLVRRARNVLAGDANGQVAETLWLGAVAGGAQAAGRPVAGLDVGQQADLVVLEHPLLGGLPPSQQLATFLFANTRQRMIGTVRVGGVERVRGGRHPAGDTARRAFVAARTALLADLP